MLDIESLGNKIDTVVISIGACFFDPKTKEIGSTYYRSLAIDEQIENGRTVTGATLKWWMQQSDAAKKVFSESAQAPQFVAQDFADFAGQYGKKHLKVFGNGADFDCSIVEHLLNQYKVKTPWMFYNTRDVRTIREFLANSEPIPKLIGTAHNALDDAINQANFVMKYIS